MNVERINAVSKDLIQAVANSTTLQSVLLEGDISIDNVKELGKSKVLQEFLDAPVGSEKDTQVKKLMATAIHIANQSDCLPFELPSSDPIEIAKLVDEGLTRVKVAYQSGCGMLDPIEVADVLIDKAAARVVALVDHAFESGMVNQALTKGSVALLTFLKVPNAQAYAPIISNVISRVERPVQNFIKNGINYIAQSAKTVVRKVASSVKNFITARIKALA
jgi:hypothetical protein